MELKKILKSIFAPLFIYLLYAVVGFIFKAQYDSVCLRHKVKACRQSTSEWVPRGTPKRLVFLSLFSLLSHSFCFSHVQN